MAAADPTDRGQVHVEPKGPATDSEVSFESVFDNHSRPAQTLDIAVFLEGGVWASGRCGNRRGHCDCRLADIPPTTPLFRVARNACCSSLKGDVQELSNSLQCSECGRVTVGTPGWLADWAIEMRLDAMVHRFPGFYEWKLDMLKVAKKGAYRLLLVDKKVAELHRHIEQKNAALIAKYLTGKHVLEVGCGRGSFLAGLVRNRGCRCVGIDASGEMIKVAAKDNPGPDYYVMDAADLKFEDQYFDVVLFNYVLHHVKDLDQTLAEAKRVGKKIIFYESCACKSTPAKQLSKLYWKLTDGGYEYLTLDEWKERFQLPVLDEIEGSGLVRYGMCVLGEAEHDHSLSA